MRFDQMKEMYELQKQARRLQKELKSTEIEAEGAGGQVTVVVTGELKIEQITIGEELLSPEKKRELEKALTDTIQEALTKARQIAAEKSQEMMKSMNVNIPGL